MLQHSFVRPLLIFSVICAASVFSALALLGYSFTWHYAFLLIYFVVVTFSLLAWQEGSKARTNIFIRRFMGGLVMKLMGSLIVFAILLKIAPPEVDKPLTVAFAGLYAAYLVFSTVRLSRVIRNASEP